MSSSPASLLFIVATPIGNLADLSPRAVATLRDVTTVFAEDTRRARALLSHLAIQGKHIVRCDAHASPEALERAVAALQDGQHAALLTDAGTPCVSDPGAALVSLAAQAGIRVIPIPGPSAILAALAVSGFSGSFLFLGFLPRSGAARRESLARIVDTSEVVILFEAGGRLTSTLHELALRQAQRPAVVARELTKLHEEIVRGTLTELALLAQEWRGELTIVLGPTATAEPMVEVSDDEIDAWIEQAREEGHSSKNTADILAARTGRPRRWAYEQVLRRKR